MFKIVSLLLLTLLPFSAHALEGSFSVGCGKGEVANIYDATTCTVELQFSKNGWLVGVLHEHRDVEKGKGDPNQTYLCGGYNFQSGTTLKACGNDDGYLFSGMHRTDTIYGMGKLDRLYYLVGSDHSNLWNKGMSRTRFTIGAGWILTPTSQLEFRANVGDQSREIVRDDASVNFVKSF